MTIAWVNEDTEEKDDEELYLFWDKIHLTKQQQQLNSIYNDDDNRNIMTNIDELIMITMMIFTISRMTMMMMTKDRKIISV